jgi:hypothetical protein
MLFRLEVLISPDSEARGRQLGDPALTQLSLLCGGRSPSSPSPPSSSSPTSIGVVVPPSASSPSPFAIAVCPLLVVTLPPLLVESLV